MDVYKKWNNRVENIHEVFKKDLIKWGINKPIRLTTTKVDERLLIDFQIQNYNILQKLQFS
jgi:hypothetical protein